MFIKCQLNSFLYLFFGIIQPLLNYFCCFCSSFLEPLLQRFEIRCIYKEIVTHNIVFVYLLCTLNINIKNTNLILKKCTFPRFMISIIFSYVFHNNSHELHNIPRIHFSNFTHLRQSYSFKFIFVHKIVLSSMNLTLPWSSCRITDAQFKKIGIFIEK